MSTVQSVVAGVGAELINNQEGLSYMKAEMLVDEHIARQNAIYQDRLSKKDAMDSNCQRELSTLNSNSDNFNREYIRIYGGTYDQVSVGNLQNPEAPCSYTLIEQQATEVGAAYAALEAIKEERLDMNNDIELLKAIEAEGGAKTYKQYFHEETKTSEDGEQVQTLYVLNSGTEAISLAAESFWNSLTAKEQSDTDKPGMNMSLFFFAISVITSLSATIMIVMHSFKLDTKMSRSTDVEDAVTYWLESVRRQYAQRSVPEGEEDKVRVNQKLISLYTDEYRESGDCDYPKVQAIAKMSQTGMDMRMIQQGHLIMNDINTAYDDIDRSASALIEHFVEFKRQNARKPSPLKSFLNAVSGNSEKVAKKENEQEITSGEAVKKNLANLRTGVTRLLLLSNRYAATVSLTGDKKTCTDIQLIEKQLKAQMSGLEVPPYNAIGSGATLSASLYKKISDLPSQLIKLQADCAELKEISREEIKNKLIPLFEEYDETVYKDQS